MPKFNFQLPNLSKKTWISLVVMVIILITLPFGIYLSQQTQIFKPRASEINSCGLGPFYLNTSCINNIPRGLIATWSNIPGKFTNDQGKIVCNVFIKDNQTTKDYSISKDCTGFAQVNVLHDLDGNNPDAEIVPNRSYSLYISDGENVINGCFNILVNTTTAQCTDSIPISTPTPSPRPVGLNRPPNAGPNYINWLFAMRDLGIYPEYENGEIVYYDRAGFLKKTGCDQPESQCLLSAPTNYDYLLRVWGDNEFIQLLIGELANGTIDGTRYKPLPALMPYFSKELGEIIPKSYLENDLFIERGGVLYNSIVPLDQYKTEISPEQLQKFIAKILLDKGRDYDKELDPFKIFVLYTDPFFGTQSIVNVLTLPPHKVSDNDRLNLLVGMTFIFGLSEKVALQGIKLAPSTYYDTTTIIKKTAELRNDIKSTKGLPQSKVQERLFSTMVIDTRDVPAVVVRNGIKTYDRTTVAGRSDEWQRAEEILGKVANDSKGNPLVGRFLKREEGFPEPPDGEFGGAKYWFDKEVKPALESGLAISVSKSAVLEPALNTTLQATYGLIKKDLLPGLNSEKLLGLRPTLRSGSVHVIPDEVLGKDRAGYEAGFLVVLRESTYFSANGLFVLMHELTHFINAAIAKAEGRAMHIGFHYEKWTGGTTYNQIYTALYELGTDVHASYALVLKLFPNNAELSAYDMFNYGFHNRASGYPKKFQAIVEKLNVRFQDQPEVIDYLREFALTGDANQFVARIMKIDVSQVTISDFKNVADYFKNRGFKAEARFDPKYFAENNDIKVLAATSSNINYDNLPGFNDYNKRPVGLSYELAPDFVIPEGIDSITDNSSTIPSKSVSNILIGGRDIYKDNSVNCTRAGVTVSECAIIDGSSDKTRLCNGSVVSTVTVEYSDGTSFVQNIKIIGSNGANGLCKSAGGGADSGVLVTPTPQSTPQGSTLSFETPKELTGSCNQGSLALSWKKVAGATKYQMRGKKINRSIDGINYIPTNTWTDGVPEVDRIGNSDGSEYNCFGDRCSLSFNELDPNSEYKIWVNAVDSSVNPARRSVNSYATGIGGSNYVDCKLPEEGGTASIPLNAQASCANRIITVNWDTRLASSQNNILQFYFPVRGFATNSSKYFPPTNWTDGLDVTDITKILSNNSGTNVNCNQQTNKCTFTDATRRKGNWRVWVTLKDSTNNSATAYQSKNAYVPGLIWCGD